MSMKTNKNVGWECPKCGKVWGPQVEGCLDCNDKGKGPDQPPPHPDEWLYNSFGGKIYWIEEPHDKDKKKP